MMKRINVGVIGLGRAGWDMICAELDLHPNQYRIVAGCDVLKERRDKMAQRYNCKTYSRTSGLVADSDVELVVVASRSVDHYKHAIAALKAGKTVFVEKPMCETYSQAVKMKQTAVKSGCGLYVRHNRRFEDGFMHIREVIESGILGNVFMVKLRRNSFSRRNDWQTIKRFGGGQLLNWGPHVVDHALQFLDSPVVGMWSDLKRVAAVGDAEDHIKIILHGKNDRIVDLEISGGAAISEPPYLVLGTKGGLKSDGYTIELRYLDPKQKLRNLRADADTPRSGYGNGEKLKWIEKVVTVKPKGPDSKKDIWGHLYDTIRRGKPFPIKLDEAVAVMRIISQAKQGTSFR
ncbi:MAG: Gfo/Idh/MocA family oxidoreductase [Lentisphaerae bacterium]|nr:Gfo/Idh/MocA family oxidoreductase [Lentisphaerota bacterium]